MSFKTEKDVWFEMSVRETSTQGQAFMITI